MKTHKEDVLHRVYLDKVVHNTTTLKNRSVYTKADGTLCLRMYDRMMPLVREAGALVWNHYCITVKPIDMVKVLHTEDVLVLVFMRDVLDSSKLEKNRTIVVKEGVEFMKCYDTLKPVTRNAEGVATVEFRYVRGTSYSMGEFIEKMKKEGATSITLLPPSGL